MITLTSRQRTQYIISVAVIEHLDNLADGKGFDELPIEARRALRTASTSLKKWRDTAPKGLERKSCQQLINDISNYHLGIEYKGTKRASVNADELENLVSYAVMGMCNGCTLTGKAAERCPFKKEWHDQLVESDCPTGDCPYSFTFDKNEVWK